MSNALGQEIRLFELEEAERMLPLIRSIVKGMMDDHEERQALLVRIEGLPRDARETRALQREVETLAEKLVEAAEELAELGLEFKGIELGLVDFPALKDGELVYLCWQYGEEEIRFWHPLETGYAGRQSIPRDRVPPD